MKIVSWNVAGIRACYKKSELSFINDEKPDIICFQESKCEESQFPPNLFPEYIKYWNATKLRKGLHGTSIWTKIKPIKVEFGNDLEGRVIHMEFEGFNIVNVYTPNSKMDLSGLTRRINQWDPEFRSFVNELNQSKPTILCGDFNVAHTEIDIYNHIGMSKSPGYTDLERESFTLLTDTFVDIHRMKYPEAKSLFTFWPYVVRTARELNQGWRLDYILIDKTLIDKSQESSILKHVMGSDHCPISLIIEF